jgi:hypothetical protein
MGDGGHVLGRVGAMIDTFALVLSHGLLALAAWKLVRRPDLDADEARPRPAWGRRDDA